MLRFCRLSIAVAAEQPLQSKNFGQEFSVVGPGGTAGLPEAVRELEPGNGVVLQRSKPAARATELPATLASAAGSNPSLFLQSSVIPDGLNELAVAPPRSLA